MHNRWFSKDRLFFVVVVAVVVLTTSISCESFSLILTVNGSVVLTTGLTNLL
jgi:hypothetical protein